jgi:DNA-binding NarL/FixJ family response regulator
MIQNIINGQDVSERFDRFLARYTACSKINDDCIGCVLKEQCVKYYNMACEGYPNLKYTQLAYENVRPPLMTNYTGDCARVSTEVKRQEIVEDYVNGLERQDIAEKHNLSEKTVKVYLGRR